MDNLLAFTLECFRSCYKILEHAARVDAQPVSQAAPSPTAATPSSPLATSLPLPPPPSHTSTSKSTLGHADDDNSNGIDWHAPVKHDAPTLEDEGRTQRLTGHTFMLEIFATALRQRRWTPHDRVLAAAAPGVAEAPSESKSQSGRPVNQHQTPLPAARLHASTRRAHIRSGRARTMSFRARPPRLDCC